MSKQAKKVDRISSSNSITETWSVKELELMQKQEDASVFALTAGTDACAGIGIDAGSSAIAIASAGAAAPVPAVSVSLR